MSSEAFHLRQLHVNERYVAIEIKNGPNEAPLGFGAAIARFPESALAGVFLPTEARASFQLLDSANAPFSSKFRPIPTCLIIEDPTSKQSVEDAILKARVNSQQIPFLPNSFRGFLRHFTAPQTAAQQVLANANAETVNTMMVSEQISSKS